MWEFDTKLRCLMMGLPARFVFSEAYRAREREFEMFGKWERNAERKSEKAIVVGKDAGDGIPIGHCVFYGTGLLRRGSMGLVLVGELHYNLHSSGSKFSPSFISSLSRFSE